MRGGNIRSHSPRSQNTKRRSRFTTEAKRDPWGKKGDKKPTTEELKESTDDDDD